MTLSDQRRGPGIEEGGRVGSIGRLGHFEEPLFLRGRKLNLQTARHACAENLICVPPAPPSPPSRENPLELKNYKKFVPDFFVCFSKNSSMNVENYNIFIIYLKCLIYL